MTDEKSVRATLDGGASETQHKSLNHRTPLRGVCLLPAHPRDERAEVALPDCFNDHSAPPSVRVLFHRWATAADRRPNGVVAISTHQEINEATGRPYSHHTVAAAVSWLIRHRLLARVEDGRRGGRGRRSSFLVRWSPTHASLTARKAAVNRRWLPETGHPSQTPLGTASAKPYARGGLRREETHGRNPARSCGSNRLRDANPTPLSSKALRFCIAAARAEVNALPDVGPAVRRVFANGLAAIMHREWAAGRLPPGPQLGRFVDELRSRVATLPAEDIWDDAHAADGAAADSDAASEWAWRSLSWAYWQVGEARQAAAEPVKPRRAADSIEQDRPRVPSSRPAAHRSGAVFDSEPEDWARYEARVNRKSRGIEYAPAAVHEPPAPTVRRPDDLVPVVGLAAEIRRMAAGGKPQADSP